MMNKIIEKIRQLTPSDKIRVLGLRGHAKASEKYVDVEFSYPKDNFGWEGSIPYYYRRTGLFLETPEEIAELIKDAYSSLARENRKKWAKEERRLWNEKHKAKKVTKVFFDQILNLQWNCVNCDLPKNPNWARRIQKIKEMGYLIATERRRCNRCKENRTHILLIPFGRGSETGYEVWSQKLRKRIVNVLNKIDVYENKRASSANALIPDHKFPEIRWDESTKAENPDDMSEEEIQRKFQLLDNRRNLQKREVCRRCYQTNKRGFAFGIKYFYKGSENWPKGIPKRGKAAEKGCVGCPWYDLAKWRESLNKRLKAKHQNGRALL